MIEYIEREAALMKLMQDGCNAKNLQSILDMPAADVAPMAHSYWESYDCSQYMGTDEYGGPKWRDGKFYVCHNRSCRRKTVVKSHYCPDCGAKMDGGAENG